MARVYKEKESRGGMVYSQTTYYSLEKQSYGTGFGLLE